MAWILTKYLLSAGLVVLITELAKRSDRLGGLLAALPLLTVISLVWLHLERQPQAKVAAHAYYTFWYVLPTLPMFLLFPWLLPKVGFWGSLALSAALTLLCFAGQMALLKALGVKGF
jgi:hypothetical protein